MKDDWKDDFFGIQRPNSIGNLKYLKPGHATVFNEDEALDLSFYCPEVSPGVYRPDISTLQSNWANGVSAHIRFRKGGGKEARHLHNFIGHFFVLCACVAIEADSFMGKRWIRKAFKHSRVDLGLSYSKTSRIYYEVFFAYSYFTEKWYVLSSGHDQYDIQIEAHPFKSSDWHFNYHSLPTIGTDQLDTVRSFLTDTGIMNVCLDGVWSDIEQVEKEQESTENTLTRVREELSRHLSEGLIDSNFIIEDEGSREKLVSLTINGDLVLEGLDVSRLSVEGLIESISSRLPEDQQQAFRERTEELINAYTST